MYRNIHFWHIFIGIYSNDSSYKNTDSSQVVKSEMKAFESMVIPTGELSANPNRQNIANFWRKYEPIYRMH